jgi:hypothetical protein
MAVFQMLSEEKGSSQRSRHGGAPAAAAARASSSASSSAAPAPAPDCSSASNRTAVPARSMAWSSSRQAGAEQRGLPVAHHAAVLNRGSNIRPARASHCQARGRHSMHCPGIGAADSQIDRGRQRPSGDGKQRPPEGERARPSACSRARGGRFGQTLRPPGDRVSHAHR